MRSRQIVRHGLVNMIERSNGRTPGVQGAMGPHSLVQLLYTEYTGTVRDQFAGGVQIRTAGVRKYRSLNIVCIGLVNIQQRSKGHTPGVQGAMGPLSLVQFVYTQPTKAVRNLLEAAVQIRTAGVHKCRTLQIVRHGIVNVFEWSNGRTPGVQGATGPSSLVQLVYTQPNATVRRPTSESCTDSYSRCTKMPFTADCSPRPIEHA